MTFRGTNLNVTEVTLSSSGSGPRLEFSLSFYDDEGVVHATTRHTVDPTAEPKMHAAAASLLEAIRAFSRSVHFNDTAAAEKAPYGIFESLSAPTDTSDDVGEQG